MAEKIKIGVFGAHRGMTMIRVLAKHPHATLVAVCDKYTPLLDKVKALADEHGLDVALYPDFEDFFKHDMDAVVLANYANEHAPFAIRLLRSGRHVMSEVLPCETMAQAVELIEAVEESGKVYAYAENYCYMWHSFEMRRRYEAGEIGEVQYCEGEYIHDCCAIWPGITYGDPDHWRNNLYHTYYCTHSFGPLMTITGRRPVKVTGLITQPNYRNRPLGLKSGECGGIEMVTLDNGAIARSVHGYLKREPGSTNFRVYGMKGCMESEMFKPSYAAEEAGRELHVYKEGDKLCVGDSEKYVPDPAAHVALAKEFTSHGGSDFYPTHFFIEKIRGTEEGKKYSIDVYDAVDMGIIGILAYRSALAGGMPMDVPNLRNKEERDAWRNDHKCTNPNVAKGDDLLPCAPGGNIVYPDSVYKEMEELFLAGKNAE